MKDFLLLGRHELSDILGHQSLCWSQLLGLGLYLLIEAVSLCDLFLHLLDLLLDRANVVLRTWVNTSEKVQLDPFILGEIVAQ